MGPDVENERTTKPDSAAPALPGGLGVWLRRAVLWLTGRDLMKPRLPTLPQGVYRMVSWSPEPRWEVTLSADAYLTFPLPTGPNVLHRLAQRFVLGIRWRMLPITTDMKEQK